MSFGDNLRRIRRDRGLTQQELAKESDIRYGHISKMERGIGDPKLSTIYKLTNALDVSADSLLMDTENMEINGIARIISERITGLPEDYKEAIIKTIDTYCAGAGHKHQMKLQMKDANDSLWIIMKGQTKDIM